jgi:GNAT superfamily N-acetyltransferase
MDFAGSRVANAKDADAISALVNSAYRGETSKRGWTTEADLLGGQRTDPDTLRKTIGDERNAILLVEEEGAPVCCVFLQRIADRAYLGMLTVKPELQARGLGKRLIAAAEQWVRDTWQAKTIEMTVIQKRRELIAWYERRGYANTGRTEPFPYGDEKFGLPKVDDLEFVVLEKSLQLA